MKRTAATSARRWGGWGWLVGCALAVVGLRCADDPAIDARGWATPWLHTCEANTDCSNGAYCRCGVCVRGCSDGAECHQAQCIDSGVIAGVVGCAEANVGLPAAVCGVVCASSGDCPGGPELSECREGVCVQLTR